MNRRAQGHTAGLTAGLTAHGMIPQMPTFS